MQEVSLVAAARSHQVECHIPSWGTKNKDYRGRFREFEDRRVSHKLYGNMEPARHRPARSRTGMVNGATSDMSTMPSSASYGISQLQRAEDGTEYEIVNGMRVTHYN
ncbi:hypothetical protein BGW80DRAFT_1446073 [Lactifluus volemus]|nr:hypothetical protein BGW80DRAFT_1446073 [Lactifluus volemus]